MVVRRYAEIGGLCAALCACEVSSGGLDSSAAGSLPRDASKPTATDAALALFDASEDAAQSADGAQAADRAQPDPCPLAGTYALTLEASVHWEATRVIGLVSLIAPGDGKVTVHSLVEVGDGSGHPVSVRLCGIELPDFDSSLDEVHGSDFPDEVWEQVSTRWTTQAHIGCPGPGCGFSWEPTTLQLGLDIPRNSTWPTSRDPIAEPAQRDDDGDGLPGVRLRMRGPTDDPKYQYPPTTFLRTVRVSEIQLALRLGILLDGMVESCDARSGVTTGMTLEMRALACRVVGGATCNQDELGFVDDGLPIWTVQSATFRAERVATTASCADARALIGSGN